MRDKVFFKGTLQEACNFAGRSAKKQNWTYALDKSNPDMPTVYLSHLVDPNRFVFGSREVLSGSFSKFVWGSGVARNGSREYNLQHLMTQERGDVWTHAEISTNFYN